MASGLHLAAACPSLYVYCTRVLGLSEDEAFKRIRAARVLRKYPVVAAAVADGRLHLTAVVLLAPHIDDDSADQLVAEASGKSKAEIEIFLARRVPRPDVSARLERLAEQTTLLLDGESDASEVVLEPRPPVPPRLAPLSPDRFALQLTINEGTRTKLLQAQALLRHQVPSGDLSEVLDLVLDGFLDGVRILCKSHNQHEAERILGRAAVEAGKAAKAMDDDLIAGLRRMGVTASDARQAVAASRGSGEVEERMRAALAALRSIYARRDRGTRCQEPHRDFRPDGQGAGASSARRNARASAQAAAASFGW